MSNRPEIVLPAALEWLTVEEIPGIIAISFFPQARDEALAAALANATSDDERQQCTDTHMAAAIRFEGETKKHAAVLERAINAGKLQTYSAGMAPLDPMDGATVSGRVKVQDFMGYVNECIPGISVRIEQPPVARTKTELQTSTLPERAVTVEGKAPAEDVAPPAQQV